MRRRKNRSVELFPSIPNFGINHGVPVVKAICKIIDLERIQIFERVSYIDRVGGRHLAFGYPKLTETNDAAHFVLPKRRVRQFFFQSSTMVRDSSSMLSTLSTRQVHLRRSPTPYKGRMSIDDADVIRYVANHRFLRSPTSRASRCCRSKSARARQRTLSLRAPDRPHSLFDLPAEKGSADHIFALGIIRPVYTISIFHRATLHRYSTCNLFVRMILFIYIINRQMYYLQLCMIEKINLASAGSKDTVKEKNQYDSDTNENHDITALNPEEWRDISVVVGEAMNDRLAMPSGMREAIYSYWESRNRLQDYCNLMSEAKEQEKPFEELYLERSGLPENYHKPLLEHEWRYVAMALQSVRALGFEKAFEPYINKLRLEDSSIAGLYLTSEGVQKARQFLDAPPENLKAHGLRAADSHKIDVWENCKPALQTLLDLMKDGGPVPRSVWF